VRCINLLLTDIDITAHMPLLTENSAFRLGRIRRNSPQQCYLHCLRVPCWYSNRSIRPHRHGVTPLLHCMRPPGANTGGVCFQSRIEDVLPSAPSQRRPNNIAILILTYTVLQNWKEDWCCQTNGASCQICFYFNKIFHR